MDISVIELPEAAGAKPSSTTFDPNNLARGAITGAIGLIPYAGAIASKIILLFWPENKEDVWGSIEDRARNLIRSMIDEERLSLLRRELDGLGNDIKQLCVYKPHTEPARRQFQDIINAFEKRQPLFCNPADPLGTLPLLVEMATMHLVFLKARCDDPSSIDEKPTDEETLKNYKDHLSKQIAYYHSQVETAWRDAHSKRMAMLKLTTGSNPSWRTVTDGLTGKEYTYADSATGYHPGMGDQARWVTLINDWELATLESYLVPAHSWRMLDPYKPMRNWSDDLDPVNRWLLNLQDKPYDRNNYDFQSKVTSAGRIEYFDVWHGTTIERIEVKCAGKTPVGNGTATSKHKRERIAVPAGRYVNQVKAELIDKMVSFGVVLDDGTSTVIKSEASGRRDGKWQTASFPEYGLGALGIGERCCALQITMLPVKKLPR